MSKMHLHAKHTTWCGFLTSKSWGGLGHVYITYKKNNTVSPLFRQGGQTKIGWLQRREKLRNIGWHSEDTLSGLE